ncbi:MAG: HesA/MoeB/ThiF family protein [Rickettsiaceae bacterium H1]|nr:HesA/MoeB/ThiF family protein [Rickettsiaceae bacterium H1]
MHSRYSGNISLIGYSGQDVLLDSKVLVIGAGGLASPLLYYLAALGIGTIGIVDGDKISLSNLQRQILYNTRVINKPKVEQAKKALNQLNPECKIITYKFFITKKNAGIIDDYDVIAECSDNFTTKLLLSKECYLRKKPLVLASAIGYKGYVGTFKPYINKNYPCYKCFCPEIPNDKHLQSCDVNGVLNSVIGTVGSIQGTKVIKELLHIDYEIPNKLTRVNMDSFSVSVIKKDLKCNICNL